MWVGDFLLTSVKFPCSLGTFRYLLPSFCAARRLMVKFLCGRETFLQLPSTFCAAGRPSINFCQIFLRPETFCQLPLTFLAASRLRTVNILCGQETFRQLLSTFCASRRPSVHFRQLSVTLGDLPSTSVNFLFSQKNFHQLSLRL